MLPTVEEGALMKFLLIVIVVLVVAFLVWKFLIARRS